jgi:hypothetical protein
MARHTSCSADGDVCLQTFHVPTIRGGVSTLTPRLLPASRAVPEVVEQRGLLRPFLLYVGADTIDDDGFDARR